MVQEIGLDIGRGYVKAYSEYNGIVKSCMFKAVCGEGRSIDTSNYENPIQIEFEKFDYFIGLLAEKESQVANRNAKDSKVSETVQVLFAAALNEVAIADNVKIVLGVPYKSFRKTVLSEVVETYKGRTFEVKDKLKGGKKTVTIDSISIFRESDAALYWELREVKTNQKPVGMVTVGFRSTELSYFEPGLKFNDKKSKTIEFGNRSAMLLVKDTLEKDDIIKEVNEIDTSNQYDKLKKKAYSLATERVEQEIEDAWVNLSEMDIYIAGGTALNMSFDKQFKLVDDSQMATAKGLYLVATRINK